MSLLHYAELALDGNTLRSRQYHDIYYQSGQGFAESDHTFIHANHLPQRFANTDTTFTIGEIGFGSGLNFINSAQHFLKHNHSAILYYCSVEKHPIERQTLETLQRDWPLSDLRQRLYHDYPDNHPGFHYLKPHPRIRLLLLLGEAQTMLDSLQAQVNAWYLDGFAPSKNPDCWHPTLWTTIVQCSAANATLSSFSVARSVRDGLSQAGFQVRKSKGFAGKRDMLQAQLTRPIASPPSWQHYSPPTNLATIAVIGAGIAGATTANALAQHGYRVDVYHNEHHHPAASHVPLAVPYLKPDRTPTPQRRYQLNAWHHALRTYRHLNTLNPEIFTPLPVIDAASDDHNSKRLHAIHAQRLLNEQQWQLQDNALHYLRAGAIQPRPLLNTLLTHPNIALHQQAIGRLTPKPGYHWRVGSQTYSAVILATAWQTTLLPESGIASTLRPIRGQGTLIHSTRKPKHVYCQQRTIIPHPNASCVYVGASFTPNSTDLKPNHQDNQDNLNAYHQYSRQPSLRHLNHFVGIRAASRDYQPLLGPIPIESSIDQAYGKWRQDSKLTIRANIAYHEHLYIHAGLGAKGFTNAFLNADILTAMLNGTPLPIEKHHLAFLLPARVLIKQLIHRQR